MASIKLSSGFSWADEVEKEEQSHEVENTQRGPNTFGSARPREVVLEEKGIDWRKLEQLHPQSIPPRKEKKKKLKENIPTIATEITELLPTRFRVLNAIENSSPLVPPLMYPPRNYLDLVKSLESARETSRRCVTSTDHRWEQVQFQEVNRELMFRPGRRNNDDRDDDRITHSKSKPRNLKHIAVCDNKEKGSRESECRKSRQRVKATRQRNEIDDINKKRRSSSVDERGVKLDGRGFDDRRSGESWDGPVDVRAGFPGELRGVESKGSHYYRTARSGEGLLMRGADGYGGRETCVGGMLQTSNEAKSYQQPHSMSGKMGRKDNGFSIRGRYRSGRGRIGSNRGG